MNKIDLTKSQLVLEDIKVRVWINNYTPEERYLYVIDHRKDFPYLVWCGGRTGKEWNYDFNHTSLYKNCELIEAESDEYMTIEEAIMFEKVNNIVVYCGGTLIYSSTLFDIYPIHSKKYSWQVFDSENYKLIGEPKPFLKKYLSGKQTNKLHEYLM